MHVQRLYGPYRTQMFATIARVGLVQGNRFPSARHMTAKTKYFMEGNVYSSNRNSRGPLSNATTERIPHTPSWSPILSRTLTHSLFVPPLPSPCNHVFFFFCIWPTHSWNKTLILHDIAYNAGNDPVLLQCYFLYSYVHIGARLQPTGAFRFTLSLRLLRIALSLPHYNLVRYLCKYVFENWLLSVTSDCRLRVRLWSKCTCLRKCARTEGNTLA
jgi:hypothetical protein